MHGSTVCEQLNRYRLPGTIIKHGAWNDFKNGLPSWGILPDPSVHDNTAANAANSNPRFGCVKLTIVDGKWKSIHRLDGNGMEVIDYCVVSSWPLYSIADMSVRAENERREKERKNIIRKNLSIPLPKELIEIIESYDTCAVQWRIDVQTSRSIVAQQIIRHSPSPSSNAQWYRMAANHIKVAKDYFGDDLANRYVPVSMGSTPRIQLSQIVGEIYYWENSLPAYALISHGYRGSIVIAGLSRKCLSRDILSRSFRDYEPLFVCYLSAEVPSVINGTASSSAYPELGTYATQNHVKCSTERFYIATEICHFTSILDHACNSRVQAYFSRQFDFHCNCVDRSRFCCNPAITSK